MYERPGIPRIDARIAAARQAYTGEATPAGASAEAGAAPAGGLQPGAAREEFRQSITSLPKMSEDQVDTAMQVYDSLADSWAKTQGKTPEDFWNLIQAKFEGASAELESAAPSESPATLPGGAGRAAASGETPEFNAASNAILAQSEAGDFGPRYPQFSGQPEAAIDHLLSQKQGEVPAAINKEGLGPIDLVWGKAGENGYGLAHVVERHGEETARKIPQIIAEGQVRMESPQNAAVIETLLHKAVIRLDWDGKQKRWLVTAYEKSPRPGRTSDLGQAYGSDKAPSERGDIQFTVGSTSQNVKTNPSEQRRAGTPLFQEGRDKSARLRDFLTGAPVATSAGTEVPRFEKHAELADWVGRYFQEQHGGKAENPQLGEVVIDRRSAKASISHGLSMAKAQAFYLVPEIIGKGEVIGSQKKYGPTGMAGHFLGAPIEIDGKRFVAIAVVRQDANIQRFYLHEVIPTEKLQQPPKTGAAQAQRTGVATGAIKNILQEIFPVNESLEQRSQRPLLKGLTQPLGDGRVLFKWFKDADFSTVTHEASHFLTQFLEGKDLVAANRFIGRKLDTSVARWNRANHEKLARAWERYLSDGIAPSADSRAAFRKMKVWFVDIYGVARDSLGDEVPEDLRAVFDRWLSDEAQRKANVLYQMNDEYDNATDGSIEAIARERVGHKIDEAESKLRQRFERNLRKQAEKTYDEDPFHQAVSEMQEKDNLPGRGIKHSLISADWDVDTICMISRKYPGLISKKGDLTVDDAALKAGFKSGDDFIRALLSTPTRAGYVEGHIEDGMRAHGNELQLSEIDLLAARVQAEIEAIKEAQPSLADLVTATKPREQWNFLEQEGRKRASEITQDTDYDNLKAAIRMSARNARRAFAAGKSEAGLRQKVRQKELLDLLKERMTAREEVQKLTAQGWGKRTGKPPEECYSRYLAGMAALQVGGKNQGIFKRLFEPVLNERGGLFQNPQGVGTIPELYDFSLSDKTNRKAEIKYATVGPQEAARLKRDTGLDVEGFEHSIDNYAIRHIHKNHGDPTAEEARGQIAITKDDISKIPEIVESPDSIIPLKTDSGRDGIGYTKKVNGHVFYVEEVRTKRNQLATVSMRIFKAGGSTPAGQGQSGASILPREPSTQTLTSATHPVSDIDSVADEIVSDKRTTRKKSAKAERGDRTAR